MRARGSNSNSVQRKSPLHGTLVLRAMKEENNFDAPVVVEEAQDSMKVPRLALTAESTRS